MRSLLTLLILLLISASAAAQEATPETSPEGWEVVQRCITAPSEPPEHWTFEGTIFTYKPNDGVHAFRADVPSRYYIAFESASEFASGGAFSPDGRWFAVPAGREEYANMVDHLYWIEEIRVYATAPAQTMYRISWDLRHFASHRQLVAPLRWLDDEHLLYSGGHYGSTFQVHLVNPFSGEITDFVFPENHYLLSLSPDGTRRLERVHDSTRSTSPSYVLYDHGLDAEITSLPPLTPPSIGWVSQTDHPLRWTTDSSRFVSLVRNEEQVSIQLFDRDGQLLDVITVIEDGGLYFSIDQTGSRLAYNALNTTLRIADLATKQIVDTCIQPAYRGTAISPDGSQIALSIGQDGFVYILDIEDWAVYRLDLAAADVIAWFPSA
jgi:WD40 repeat protein